MLDNTKKDDDSLAIKKQIDPEQFYAILEMKNKEIFNLHLQVAEERVKFVKLSKYVDGKNYFFYHKAIAKRNNDILRYKSELDSVRNERDRTLGELNWYKSSNGYKLWRFYNSLYERKYTSWILKVARKVFSKIKKILTS